MDPRFRTLLAWGWLVGYTALVFHLAVRPLPRLPELFGQFDKSLHALEYALLFWAASAAFLRSPLGAGAAYAALAYAVFVGALTEILQASVPGRSADAFDCVADFSGAGVALGVLWCWRHRLPAALFGKPALRKAPPKEVAG